MGCTRTLYKHPQHSLHLHTPQLNLFWCVTIYTSSTLQVLLVLLFLLFSKDSLHIRSWYLGTRVQQRQKVHVCVLCKYLQLGISGFDVQCLTNHWQPTKHSSARPTRTCWSLTEVHLLHISRCGHRCPVSLLQNYQSSRRQSYRKPDDKLYLELITANCEQEKNMSRVKIERRGLGDWPGSTGKSWKANRQMHSVGKGNPEARNLVIGTTKEATGKEAEDEHQTQRTNMH